MKWNVSRSYSCSAYFHFVPVYFHSIAEWVSSSYLSCCKHSFSFFSYDGWGGEFSIDCLLFQKWVSLKLKSHTPHHFLFTPHITLVLRFFLLHITYHGNTINRKTLLFPSSHVCVFCYFLFTRFQGFHRVTKYKPLKTHNATTIELQLNKFFCFVAGNVFSSYNVFNAQVLKTSVAILAIRQVLISTKSITLAQTSRMQNCCHRK